MPPPESPATTVNVSTVIDNAAVGPLHVSIVTICTLCLVIDGFDVQAISYVAPAIIQDWGIAPSLLGPVFGGGNLGVLIGQLAVPIVADRIGRRPVLIAGVVFLAAMTFLTAFAATVPQLLAIRLVAGIGFGAVIPNAFALIGEFSPARLRVTLLTWTAIGFTVGAALGGFLAAWIIPRFGWQTVFYVGAAAPVVLAGALYVWLPESLKLIVLSDRPGSTPYVARWLRRIDPAQVPEGDVRFVVSETRHAGVSVAQLFREGRGGFTTLLWIVNFMNLLMVFSLSNWLPTVVQGLGYSVSTAALVGTTLQVGGILSPFLFAWLIVRRGFSPVLTIVFAVAALATAAIGSPGLSLPLLMAIVFVAGACVVGGQASINAMSGAFYPTSLRATGVGWGLGIGRTGAIVGPVVAGIFIALQWTTGSIFLALALPAAVSMAAMAALRFVPQGPRA
ncbi:MAG: MFS transporter [Acidimicrobiia bacterium]|nr:MFS transporter [Acidimicrobiia bacterium]